MLESVEKFKGTVGGFGTLHTLAWFAFPLLSISLEVWWNNQPSAYITHPSSVPTLHQVMEPSQFS